MLRKSLLTAFLALAVHWTYASPVLADIVQEEASDTAFPSLSSASIAPNVSDGKQIYTPDQFARFAPRTAFDMVVRIPGFSISGVSSNRGLGEASQNVLLNGQRITGKTNDAGNLLSKTPAEAVVRLEIVDGATLNIPGLTGQVLNLVTKSVGISGNFLWRNYFVANSEVLWTAGEVSISGKLGRGDFTLGLANNAGSYRAGSSGVEQVFDADKNLLFFNERDNRYNGDRPTLTATYASKSAAGNNFNANILFLLSETNGYQNYLRKTDGAPDIFESNQFNNDEHGLELGADYEFDLGGGRLKLIGYERYISNPSDATFSRLFDDGSDNSATRYASNRKSGESVVRAEYGWKTGNSDWRISAEGAYNFLSSTANLSDVAGPQPIFIPLNNADTDVDEKRAEIILSYGRPLSQNLTLQAQVGAEYSKLSQSGIGAGSSRQFYRPKGSLSLAWKAAGNLDISARLERAIGQLDFGDFLASVDLRDSNNNIGNPELVPPQSWLALAEINRSLGKTGSINVKVKQEWISDLVEQKPFGPDAESPGNLDGTARRLSAELQSTFFLDALGIKGGKLELSSAYRRGRLIDPLFLTSRELSSQQRFSISLGYSHDIQKSNWSYGFGMNDSVTSDSFRLDFANRAFFSGPQYYAFISNRDLFGLETSFTVNNISNRRELYDQILYVGRRDGDISQVRSGTLKTGIGASLAVKGEF
ncbi:MAG: hypothetical protein HC843_07965 [Sphingomonadales bacterium]|nr:hypothetical protein [Sphingomonadales bacterium]